MKNDTIKIEIKEKDAQPKAKTKAEAIDEADAKDYQLRRAVDLIRGISLYTSNKTAP